MITFGVRVGIYVVSVSIMSIDYREDCLHIIMVMICEAQCDRNERLLSAQHMLLDWA